MAQDGPAWPNIGQIRGKMGPSSVWKLHIKRKLFVIGSQDRLKMRPTLGIFAPRARAPATDFQEVIGAKGLRIIYYKSDCKYRSSDAKFAFDLSFFKEVSQKSFLYK